MWGTLRGRWWLAGASALVVGLTVAALSSPLAQRWEPSSTVVNTFRTALHLPPIYEPAILGQIKLGIHAGEICTLMQTDGCSTLYLSQPKTYAEYRRLIRKTYGADLEDMSYYRAGDIDPVERAGRLGSWLRMALEYGDVTVALEPINDDYRAIFTDTQEMQALRQQFQILQNKKGKILIRFASEANLYSSAYSVSKHPEKCQDYIDAARWFKSYMPPNVELVFCPLINTAAKPNNKQREMLEMMFFGPDKGQAPWSRLGGTIYRTDQELEATYDIYYQMMTEMNSTLPFEISELGGPWSAREEVKNFLMDAARGRWPRLAKINLFARPINERSDPDASFGYIDPEIRARAESGALTKEEKEQVRSFLHKLLRG